MFNHQQNNSESNADYTFVDLIRDLFENMSDNQTVEQTSISNRSFLNSATPSTSRTSISSSEMHFVQNGFDKSHPFPILASFSYWIVLLVNPLVILFGVTGNLLATYILIRCNIAKLPVSFYTVMLNIADTLNLLIPVFIFWLDNIFHQSSDGRYFRDRSNFLCKALMCPDQLFAALSAWYMCAISFNRWRSVCRPSSYFLRHTNVNTSSPNRNSTSVSLKTSFVRLCSSFDFSIVIRSRKFRSHWKAFRSIALITLLGILSCIYPIFMHELRKTQTTTAVNSDSKRKLTQNYAVSMMRCNFSAKHEHIYDIVGIILSCFLHILPLTFVAVMNLMIIIELRHRQQMMSSTTKSINSSRFSIHRKKSSQLRNLRFDRIESMTTNKLEDFPKKSSLANQRTTLKGKDQATSIDLTILQRHRVAEKLPSSMKSNVQKRHHSRDRTITIMLVGVALSYLILTLPYRLFWSYNVYTKRTFRERSSSSGYLLRMHYIDHLLRTIRNIHYGTNFIFFIFLSKTFRRRFYQIFIEKILQKTNRWCHRTNPSIDNGSSNSHRHKKLQVKLVKNVVEKQNDDRLVSIDRLSKNLFVNRLKDDETEDRLNENEEQLPIVKFDYRPMMRYDGEQK